MSPAPGISLGAEREGAFHMKYTLPLSPDYVSGWSDWHAVRELLQNAMDAHDAGGCKPRMDYDPQSKTLVVESPKERLPRRSLLLGGTTKADDDSQRGKFGEGYKLALLVFCRSLYDVTVINGGERWTPTFERNSDFDGERVLTIDISPEPEPFDGVRFSIQGFPESSWELVKSRWLPEMDNDSILSFQQRGNIYCGGLFITNCNRLLRGYNFAPSRLNLGRDRDIVGDFDLCYQTSQLWSRPKGARHAIELMAMLKNSAADVEYVNYVPATEAAIIVKEYEKEFGDGTVPVSNQQELDKVRAAGFNGQIVCDSLKKIVLGVKKFVFHELRTPGGKMKQFFDKHKEKLNLDVREELEILVNESKGWR